jgi:hypothetical protein
VSEIQEKKSKKSLFFQKNKYIFLYFNFQFSISNSNSDLKFFDFEIFYLNFGHLFSKNHISVSVLTTPKKNLIPPAFKHWEFSENDLIFDLADLLGAQKWILPRADIDGSPCIQGCQ